MTTLARLASRHFRVEVRPSDVALAPVAGVLLLVGLGLWLVVGAP